MYILFIILSIIAAVLLVCVILIQKSKGGGLASSFASSNQIMGVRRTNSFIEKLTWTLGGAIAVLAIASTFVAPNAVTTTGAPRVKAPAAATTTTQAGDYNTNAPTAAPTAPTAEHAPAVPAAPAAPAPEK